MNIKQLHYFYELAQHRHFAKAAKACFITQPTLSASITALEKSLGTELVVRNSQFVALTQAGEVVLRHAERMLQEQDALRQELSPGFVPNLLHTLGFVRQYQQLQKEDASPEKLDNMEMRAGLKHPLLGWPLYHDF